MSESGAARGASSVANTRDGPLEGPTTVTAATSLLSSPGQAAAPMLDEAVLRQYWLMFGGCSSVQLRIASSKLHSTMLNDAFSETNDGKKTRATGSLRWAALVLGELRDGLTMVSQECFQRTAHLNRAHD
jgi:hypothetical protein